MVERTAALNATVYKVKHKVQEILGENYLYSKMGTLTNALWSMACPHAPLQNRSISDNTRCSTLSSQAGQSIIRKLDIGKVSSIFLNGSW